MLICIRQAAACHPKFAFTTTFIFFSPICPNDRGVVCLGKYILVFEKLFFFVQQLKYAHFSTSGISVNIILCFLFTTQIHKEIFTVTF